MSHLVFTSIRCIDFSVVHTAPSPNQLEKDEGFKEFLSVHQKRDQVPTWANDVVQAPGPEAGQAKSKSKKKNASDDYLNFDSDDSEVEDDDEEEEEENDPEDEDKGR